MNRKDLVDLVALLLHHPVETRWGDEVIDSGYVARVAADDWGMYRTLQVNTEKLRATLPELDVDRELVRSRRDQPWSAGAAQPNPLKRRLPGPGGDRRPCCQLPEEGGSPRRAGSGP